MGIYMKIYTKPVGSIGTNCYISADESGACAVIDPGAQPDKLVAFMEEHKLNPQYVLLTHGHYDHIGGVKGILNHFPGCKLVIGRGDAEQLADRKKSLATMRSMTEDIYIMTPDLVVNEGDKITSGALTFEVIDTPGHTKGGVSYRCGDALFTGDTMFAGNVGRADLYGGDFDVLLASVKKLAQLPGDFRVLPGHGPESTLEVERKYNPYIDRR